MKKQILLSLGLLALATGSILKAKDAQKELISLQSKYNETITIQELSDLEKKITEYLQRIKKAVSLQNKTTLIKQANQLYQNVQEKLKNKKMKKDLDLLTKKYQKIAALVQPSGDQKTALLLQLQKFEKKYPDQQVNLDLFQNIIKLTTKKELTENELYAKLTDKGYDIDVNDPNAVCSYLSELDETEKKWDEKDKVLIQFMKETLDNRIKKELGAGNTLATVEKKCKTTKKQLGAPTAPGPPALKK